jgi:hypothetical protein
VGSLIGAGCGLSPPDEQATMINGSNIAHFITFMLCLSCIAFGGIMERKAYGRVTKTWEAD